MSNLSHPRSLPPARPDHTRTHQGGLLRALKHTGSRRLRSYRTDKHSVKTRATARGAGFSRGMPPSYGALGERGTTPVAVAAPASLAGQDMVWIGAASPLLTYSPGKGGGDQGAGWVLTPQGYIQAQGSGAASVTLCELTCRWTRL